MTTIKILQYKLDDDTYKLYDVTFFQTTISTIVTTESSTVDNWIIDTEQHLDSLGPLVFGLDVEWRPNHIRNRENPIATIQLCSGNRCLIFQILRSPIIPYSLLNFLANPNYTFVGVGIDEDVAKLMKHYYLRVGRTVDLRTLAAMVYGVKELKSSGLKRLASIVLGLEINKPKKVTMSGWDNWWLMPAQVQYACIDAFLSFEIGRILICNSLFMI
ncbi:putative DNA helicase [Helianthus annuus]|nr:putative DNA helicase [Helianthus annuus]KAJ0542179.1 putative DNA helicase [Helianthus annuus]KAJ0887946.1 putative DNA helicase [Helianthus annuus]KAJ0892862.1 putative DNA helicase [Helianthus annuus]